MTIHELQSELTNSIDHAQEIESDTNRQTSLVSMLCMILYGVATLIFIALAFVSDININVQSAIIGNHHILFTLNRAILLATFSIVLVLIGVLEYMINRRIQNRLNKKILELVYGTTIGLNKIKK